MSKNTVRVLVADPFHPVLGVMLHPLLQRVMDYGRVHSPEYDPEKLAQHYAARIYSRDPSVLLLALVDEKATVVGHVLATLMNDGVKAWAAVLQYRADGSVGDAGLQALDMVQEWARGNGAQTMMLTVRNEDQKWEKRGFKSTRHIYVKDVTV